MKKRNLIILLSSSTLVLLMVILTFTTVKKKDCKYKSEKIEAAELTSLCFSKIKEYKIAHSIPLTEYDNLNSYLIGDSYTEITTTMGSIESKRTSVNPNMAAVIIDMFKEAGIKKGDQIGAVFSGSFPAINIAAMCAMQVFDAKTCIMTGIGASTYGANNPNFTFYDMAEYLYQEGVLKVRIDYVSMGGATDTKEGFLDDVSLVESRIKTMNAEFISIRDFTSNVEYREKAFKTKLPNMKMLINVGGSLVSIGSSDEGFYEKTGLIMPNYLNIVKYKNKGKIGLIERCLENGIPVIEMLNMKSISVDYEIPYDPDRIEGVGQGNVYTENRYIWAFPVIAGVVFIGLCVYFLIDRIKDNKKQKNRL